MHHPRRSSAQPLLIGISYPDGRTASNVDAHGGFGRSAAGDEPLLLQRGGGGGGRTYGVDFWLTPLPPSGDLTVVVAWPSRRIEETRTLVPAEVIADGLRRVVELWPWTPPEEPSGRGPLAMPDVPPHGWFAEHVQAAEEIDERGDGHTGER